MKAPRSLSVFVGGPATRSDDLLGNAYLSEAIYEQSQGRFLCVLSQNLDVPAAPRQAHDARIACLLGCDLALFRCEGAWLDPVTSMEFMTAKFADMPCVLVTTEAKAAGPAGEDCAAMLSRTFPRTERVGLEAASLYRISSRIKPGLKQVSLLAGQYSSATAQVMFDKLAVSVIGALDRVVRTEPAMPKYLREEAYHWLALMTGARARKKLLRRFEEFLETKVEKDLL